MFPILLGASFVEPRLQRASAVRPALAPGSARTHGALAAWAADGRDDRRRSRRVRRRDDGDGPDRRAALEAHTAALQIASIAFMVPLGLGQAATVRVGLAYGARDARAIAHAGWSAFGLTLIFAVFSATAMIGAPRLLIAPFIDVDAPENASDVALAMALLRVAALFQIVDASQVALANMLRGLHDSAGRSSLRFSAIGRSARRSAWPWDLRRRLVRSAYGLDLRPVSPLSPSFCCCAGSARSAEALRFDLGPALSTDVVQAYGTTGGGPELRTFQISDFREQQRYGAIIADRVWNAWWRNAGRPIDDVKRHMVEMADDRPLPMAVVAHNDRTAISAPPFSFIPTWRKGRSIAPGSQPYGWKPPSGDAASAGRWSRKLRRSRARLAIGAAYICCRPELEGFYLEDRLESPRTGRRRKAPIGSETRPCGASRLTIAPPFSRR